MKIGRFFAIFTRAASVFLSLTLLWACASAPAKKPVAEKAAELNPVKPAEAIQRLVQRLDAGMTAKETRLAVAAFVPTAAGTGPEFGEYFSDALTGAIRSNIRRAELYERKRIDLILKENQLAASGLVDEKQALKIGTLAPIDVLLAGTYTVFESYIDVNCRLVDISTGRTLFTHAERIVIDAELAALLGRKTGTEVKAKADGQPPQKSKEAECAEKQERIRTLLNDLSSLEKIQGVVQTASSIPFDAGCGKIHFDVMLAFRRYGIFDQDYRKFLLLQLTAIQFPSNDNRAAETFDYLAADGKVDDEEWEAGLDVLKRSRASDFSRYLTTLLQTNQENRDEDHYQTVKTRVDELVSLTLAGKVGLPVAANADQLFGELLKAFNFMYAKENRVLAYLYESFGIRLSNNPQTKAQVRALLEGMYAREPDNAQKLRFMDWIAGYYHEASLDERTAEDFFSFLRKFAVTEYTQKNPEEAEKFPKNHLELFVKKARDLFCPLVPLTKFPNQLAERIDFCLENKIECPGTIPTAEEAAIGLASREWAPRLRAAAILAKMGAKAAPAEEALVATFDDEGGGTEAEVAEFRTNVVKILGNIRTTRPRSLELLLGALGSRDSGVEENASNALASIGAPAVFYLIRGLQSDESGIQYLAASALEKIGPPAKIALAELRKLARNQNRDLKGIAEKAIASISGR